MLQTAIILAGGFGTRLQSVISDLPKPMAPVNEAPFLNYQLTYLRHFGIKKVVLSVGYLAEKIRSYYGTSYNGIELNYAFETTPMGTGGGIRLGMEQCSDDYILVLNGDSFFDINLHEFFRLHVNEKAHYSLSLRTVTEPSRYGSVITDENHCIISFREKTESRGEGKINGGVYILDRKHFLGATAADKNFSIEKDFFEKKLDALVIKGFEFKGYFIDIGIPGDYAKAQHDFKGFAYK